MSALDSTVDTKITLFYPVGEVLTCQVWQFANVRPIDVNQDTARSGIHLIFLLREVPVAHLDSQASQPVWNMRFDDILYRIRVY